MTHLPVISDNKRPDLCAPCGGKCCQRGPGAYWPADFGATDAEIRTALRAGFETGTICLDDHSEDSLVRPSIRGQTDIVQPIRITFGVGHNPCSNLTPQGCSLDFERRPTQCRALVPDPENGCMLPKDLSDNACRRAWASYRDLFAEFREED